MFCSFSDTLWDKLQIYVNSVGLHSYSNQILMEILWMPWISVCNSTAVFFVCVYHFKTSETLMAASTWNTPLQIKPIRSEAETGMQCIVIKLLIKLNALKEVVSLVQSLTISLIHILHSILGLNTAMLSNLWPNGGWFKSVFLFDH